MLEQRGGTLESKEERLQQGQDALPDGPAQKFPFWKASRRKFSAGDSFFHAGNLDRELTAKQMSLEITEEEKILINYIEEEQTFHNLFCPIAGCRTKLKSLADFESHHIQRHMSKCSVCSKVFPSTRLLNLHVSETHDSFFQAKVAHGFPMYECFVEGCAKRFQSDARRMQHLVDLHQFPRSFSFRRKKHLSQGQRSQHKQNAYKQAPDHGSSNQIKPLSSTLNTELSSKDRMPTRSPAGYTMANCLGLNPGSDPAANSDEKIVNFDVDMDNLTAGVSRLSTASQARDNMPEVISFGRRRTRGSTRK